MSRTTHSDETISAAMGRLLCCFSLWINQSVSDIVNGHVVPWGNIWKMRGRFSDVMVSLKARQDLP